MSIIAISIGQFIRRKGFDVLLRAWAQEPKEDHLYIIGAQPTEEYLELKDSLGLDNVHFEGFKCKEELKEYYQAADLFILPTREDIWGLVINEAMANGLPVITTDRCVAGLELVRDGVNGYIIPVDDVDILVKRIHQIAENSELQMSMKQASLATISEWTIENMAKKHIEVLDAHIDRLRGRSVT